MGLFDQLSDVVGSAVGGSSKNEHLMQAVVEMVQQNGGLPALLSQFQQGGLANLVSSWVGTGANSALSANQLQNALTGDQIRNGWLKHIKKNEQNYLWVSNQKAFDLMNSGILPPETSSPSLSKHMPEL